MGRSPCCDESGLKKGPWTPEEDQKLVNHIQKYGHASWRALPKLAGLNRCGKSCRLRWTNYLRPDIKRGKFSKEEEQTILDLHAILGNKWSAIASHIPGRTDNEIKNFWNTHLKKKLIQMGYDPMTHQPRTDDILTGLSHLIVLANLKELLDQHHQSWEQSLARLQEEAIQLTNLQSLQQHLVQPQFTEADLNTVSSMTNSTFMMNNDIVNVSNDTSVSPSNGIGTVQLANDSTPFSHMPELKTPSSCSPWLFSCSSTTPSPSTHVVPPVTSEVSLTNVDDNCTIWPEILLEDPFFKMIS
ncbi:hypothetical protein LR48_Vigan06g110900 [Vigna angularis]|uniref:Transcription factor n=2 Tax=Phaseolus angularis TaxID=3914 RepID=A0A0L9USS7_PHAAN|nr:transcription factor MYB53 [Vigna angularis]KAG2376866.1 Transcription factor [Vigna angularis]KOM45803.1 hypothetical protein LR48_Vigan06g110900 [Vigna angularis]BAT99197.1 hypothetical protein VIGAN_10059400 [Vigna angularis var. angularis]